AIALMNLGTMLVNVGNGAAAYPLLKEAQALYRNMGHDYFYAITIVHLANAALGLGNIAEAHDWLETATATSRVIGENWLLAFAVNNLGEVARVQGDYERARGHYEESAALLRAAGDKGDLARLIYSLGYVALHAGLYAGTEAQFSESLAMFRKLGNQRGIAECVAGFAGLRAAQGHPQQGAMLLGAAQAMMSAAGAAWWPADRVEYEQNLAHMRAALPVDAFAAAWAKGQALPMEQAIAEALEPLLEAPPTAPRVTPQPTTPTGAYPAGLSAREVEILRLVAQGLTNAQVAERLVLSAHTVHTHLRTIYGKLDVTSRAAATRFAVEHHLV
ncbi:MAG: tetratricopeptide repeat protein, partial [Chloroflexales bacterium]|nr:tetratricopeptide repeat protein [Chloroflexales bacterium]